MRLPPLLRQIPAEGGGEDGLPQPLQQRRDAVEGLLRLAAALDRLELAQRRRQVVLRLGEAALAGVQSLARTGTA